MQTEELADQPLTDADRDQLEALAIRFALADNRAGYRRWLASLPPAARVFVRSLAHRGQP